MSKEINFKYTSLFTDIENARRYWGWFLALGILLVLLGSTAIGFSFWVTEFSVILFGALLLSGGVAQTVHSFYIHKWSGFLASLILGILYFVVGVLCIIKPISSAISLTLLIGLFFFVSGILRITHSIVMRFQYWGWVLFNGILALLLGIFILAQWPLSGLWIIGFFVGIDMILLGWTWIFLSLAASRKRIPEK